MKSAALATGRHGQWFLTANHFHVFYLAHKTPTKIRYKNIGKRLNHLLLADTSESASYLPASKSRWYVTAKRINPSPASSHALCVVAGEVRVVDKRGTSMSNRIERALVAFQAAANVLNMTGTSRVVEAPRYRLVQYQGTEYEVTRDLLDMEGLLERRESFHIAVGNGVVEVKFNETHAEYEVSVVEECDGFTAHILRSIVDATLNSRYSIL